MNVFAVMLLNGEKTNFKICILIIIDSLNGGGGGVYCVQMYSQFRFTSR